MKKILFPLVLSLILILSACSAAGGDTVYTFSEEDGYGLAGMDYGGSVEELNKVLGCTLSDTEGVIGTSEPDDGVFIGEITEFLGTKGYFDAQFTDGDTGFYSVTFHTNSNYGDPEATFEELRDTYTKAFGEPDITGAEGLAEPDTIIERLRWEHEASNSMFELRLVGSEENLGLLVGLANVSALQ